MKTTGLEEKISEGDFFYLANCAVGMKSDELSSARRCQVSKAAWLSTFLGRRQPQRDAKQPWESTPALPFHLLSDHKNLQAVVLRRGARSKQKGFNPRDWKPLVLAPPAA